MVKESGRLVSTGQGIARHTCRASYFSQGVTAVMALGLLLLASGPIVGALGNDAAPTSNHILNQVRMHGSHHLGSWFISEQFQQGDASAQSSAQAPSTGGTGARASQGIHLKNSQQESTTPPSTQQSGVVQGGQVGGQ